MTTEAPSAPQTTYMHNGQHPAMRVLGHWSATEVMTAERVTWPPVAPGDPIACGTCGHRFDPAELREPYLAPSRDS